jgi:hypothetical protein
MISSQEIKDDQYVADEDLLDNDHFLALRRIAAVCGVDIPELERKHLQPILDQPLSNAGTEEPSELPADPVAEEEHAPLTDEEDPPPIAKPKKQPARPKKAPKAAAWPFPTSKENA